MNKLTLEELKNQFIEYMEHKGYKKEFLFNKEWEFNPVTKMRFKDYLECARRNNIYEDTE